MRSWGERWETARIEKRSVKKKTKERASSTIWPLGTTRSFPEPIHLHHAAIGPPPSLYNVVPLFELPLGNNKHSNFWMEDGGSMDYFVLPGDSASTILSACITGALWAKQGERGILREGRDEVRRILAIYARLELWVKCRVRLAWLLKRLLCRLQFCCRL